MREEIAAEETEPADEPMQRERDEQDARAREVPYDAIARRAYEIWESGEGGSAQENWERAATELGADPHR